MDLSPGRALGRYQILGELGRGGMGVVYRALDTTLNREVALKVLPSGAVVDDDSRRRFLREAQTASQLQHAHIGVVHEVGETEGVSFIAMELIRGESLAERIARGGLNPARAIELATEVAEGLAKAHEHGVIHRDLKPANVMITDDGHAKIIDFGLAKALDSSDAFADAQTARASTSFGVIKGTAAYMSPEQTRGEKLDARSDLFSFGVMLFQMLTGRLPFQAPSYIDTLHAISHDPAPPLTWSGAVVAGDVQQEVQRIVEKCLVKDPDARYQTARDLVVDLRSARRRLEAPSSTSASATAAAVASASPVAAVTRQRVPGLVAVITGAIVVATAAGAWWWTHRAPAAPPPLAAGGRPSVAVMYFQNNTGAEHLDWLRKGLTDMVVTDLSQSTDVDVLSTDRLYQILASLKKQNDTELSFDTLRDVARLAGVEHVLTGNYVKSGETIRINVTLQDVTSGKIVTSDHLEAAGESNLFPTVDNLTRRMQEHLGAALPRSSPGSLVPAPGGRAAETSGLYRDLEEVTTTSIDAYRNYAQGVALLESGRPREAEPLLLQAVKLDPTFALAFARLSAAENNMARLDLRARYAREALDHSDRLSPRDRYYIEGYYYGADEDTVERGIAAYQKLLTLYPQHYAGKHNLANAFQGMKRSADAARLAEELRQGAVMLPISFNNLVNVYASLGQFDQARAVMDDYQHRFPNNAVSFRTLGDLFAIFGRIDDAIAAYDRADAIDGGDPGALGSRWAYAVIQGRWADADRLMAAERQVHDPFAQYIVVSMTGLNQAYHGKVDAALATLLSPSSRGGAAGMGPTLEAELDLSAAGILLALGRPQAAIAPAMRARNVPGQVIVTPLGRSRYYQAIALSRLGRDAEAKPFIDTIATRAQASTSHVEMQRTHQLAGVLAFDRHDVATAIAELTQAETFCAVRSDWGPPPTQPELWFALGSAYLAAGNDAEAEKRFSRLTSGLERVIYPIQYVRSLYFLAQIADRRGDHARARDYYQQFLNYWGDGDVDRDKVADAKAKIGG
jgi:TolB-like protein/tetratricopeptide (TPR) repeat protein/predicted Ser/Thr protein kinase